MRSILLSFATIVLVLNSSAQTEMDNCKTTGLQFSFNGLYLGTLSAGVGGKTWISDGTCLVLSIAGSHNYSSTDSSFSQPGSTTTSTLVQIQFGAEWHFDQVASFSPFLAAAVFGRYEKRLSEYVYPQAPIAEQVSNTATVGLNVGLGAEYWIAKRLSLSGQHLFQVSYAKGTHEYEKAPIANYVTRGFNIGLGTSSLILTLYF